MRLTHIDRGLAERHYAPHKGKPFYDGLIAYITRAPVVGIRNSQENILVWRSLDSHVPKSG